MSPTSSRNSVPLSASSKRPVFWAMAPVNAPFSWPNSSLSRSPSGIAAQFSLTNAFSLRLPSLCIARATSSLPVPVSPRISTLESVGATTDARLKAVLNAGLSPMPKLGPNFLLEIAPLFGLRVAVLDRPFVVQRVLNSNGYLARNLFEKANFIFGKSALGSLYRGQHPYNAASSDKREIAPRDQTFRYGPFDETSTHVTAVTFGVVPYLFQVPKVLGLAGPESLATGRTLDRYGRSVADGPPRLRVIQDRYSQLLADLIR